MSSPPTSNGSSIPCSRTACSCRTHTRSDDGASDEPIGLLERCLERAPRPGAVTADPPEGHDPPERRPRLPAHPGAQGRRARHRRQPEPAKGIRRQRSRARGRIAAATRSGSSIWAASARLSTARGTDEFIVRDHFAEDAVRIVVVVDLSPSMALFPGWLPWLDKRAAVRAAGRMIVASGAATNALIGFAAAGAHEARSMPSRRDRAHWREIEQRLATGVPDGPPDSLDRALELLSRSARSAPPGTFVFVLSDFLPPPSPARLTNALAAGWDVSRSSSRIPSGSARSRTSQVSRCRSPTPTTARRRSYVSPAPRHARDASSTSSVPARLDQALRDFELDPVTITSSDLPGVHNAFLEWAERRRSRSRGYR